jgi:hypothetical protein
MRRAEDDGEPQLQHSTPPSFRSANVGRSAYTI